MLPNSWVIKTKHRLHGEFPVDRHLLKPEVPQSGQSEQPVLAFGCLWELFVSCCFLTSNPLTNIWSCVHVLGVTAASPDFFLPLPLKNLWLFFNWWFLGCETPHAFVRTKSCFCSHIWSPKPGLLHSNSRIVSLSAIRNREGNNGSDGAAFQENIDPVYAGKKHNFSAWKT